MKVCRYLLSVILVVSLFSCGGKKKVVSAGQQGLPKKVYSENGVIGDQPKVTEIDIPDINPRLYTVKDYIRDFSEVAMQEMRLYNIPASITLAQGILESGGGKGDLTRRANNHFGIKCHDWTGDRVYHDDDSRGECFRKYKNPSYSYRDHSLFLSQRTRYAELFELDKDDYIGWAKGLRKAGYATDRKYPDKLIGLIERYELYRFDADVLDRPSPSYVHKKEARPSVTHEVVKGDTLYGIAKRYNTTIEELQRFNNLQDANIAIGQQLYIYSTQEF